MHTINDLIKIAENHILMVDTLEKREKLTELRKELVLIKKSPELSGNCSIDFKISNGEEYLDKIKRIIGNK